MDKIAHLSTQQQRELFGETAAKKKMTVQITEKDFWVTWTLDRLFSHPRLSRQLIFKGGTSLSKVYGLIERFSEDIDLILDWRTLTQEDPEAERSRSKQERLNRKINEDARSYIATTMLEMVKESVEELCRAEVDDNDPFVINVFYPAAFEDPYLRPEIRLEIGPLAAWLPYETHELHSYAAEAFPDLFERRETFVPTIAAERTFWEKATILHHEANRPDSSQQPSRYSRHYYDMAIMAGSYVKEHALADLALLEQVVAFKKRFYPRGWADYEAARPGSLRLVPEGRIYTQVRSDYSAMRTMVFGAYPTFESIITTLQKLEEEINEQKSHDDSIGP